MGILSVGIQVGIMSRAMNKTVEAKKVCVSVNRDLSDSELSELQKFAEDNQLSISFPEAQIVCFDISCTPTQLRYWLLRLPKIEGVIVNVYPKER